MQLSAWSFKGRGSLCWVGREGFLEEGISESRSKVLVKYEDQVRRRKGERH